MNGHNKTHNLCHCFSEADLDSSVFTEVCTVKSPYPSLLSKLHTHLDTGTSSMWLSPLLPEQFHHTFYWILLPTPNFFLNTKLTLTLEAPASCCCLCFSKQFYPAAILQGPQTINNNNNNNNNRIQRRYSRFFTISSQRRELSPTCTLKWPGQVHHIERLSRASVMLRATWCVGTAQLLSLTELKSHLFELYFVGWTINSMKEGRKPEYPEKTPGDELQKMHNI